MSLQSIQQGISTVVFGKDCKLCENLGITCHEVGLFDEAPGNEGESVIYIDGNASGRRIEKINECDGVTKKKTLKKVVKEIRSNFAKSQNIINLRDNPYTK